MTEKAKQLGREQVFGYLNKRELFAAMAMQGYCGNIGAVKINSKEMAVLAVKHADALLEELSKTE